MSEPAPECVICGAPAGPPGLLFLGRRWFFCGMPHRLAFKREPERFAAERPGAGVSPVETGTAPPRTRPQGPFKVR